MEIAMLWHQGYLSALSHQRLSNDDQATAERLPNDDQATAERPPNG